MHLGKILVSAIVGTTAMTLFSYLLSDSKNKNLREPEILGQLLKRLPNHVSKKSALCAGWLAHYAIGVLFVAIYHELWKRVHIPPSIASGALLGTASGIVGAVARKWSFEAHPNPPAKDLKLFLYHLIVAHAVFGVFSASTYKLMRSR